MQDFRLRGNDTGPWNGLTGHPGNRVALTDVSDRRDLVLARRFILRQCFNIYSACCVIPETRQRYRSI